MSVPKNIPAVLPLSTGVKDVDTSKALRQLEAAVKDLQDRVKRLGG